MGTLRSGAPPQPTMKRPPRRPMMGRLGERGMTRLGKKQGVLQDVVSRKTGCHRETRTWAWNQGARGRGEAGGLFTRELLRVPSTARDLGGPQGTCPGPAPPSPGFPSGRRETETGHQTTKPPKG